MEELGLNLVFFLPIISIALCYLIGSIPTGYLVGKMFFKTDVRKSGSGNTGATNTLRSFGWKAGVGVLAFDILKAMAAILLAKHIMQNIPSERAFDAYVALCGLAAILGNVYSLWLNFKGGKGVATTAGVLLAIMPEVMLVCVVLFIITVAISRYVSLGSLLAASAAVLIEMMSLYFTEGSTLSSFLLVVVVAGMIFWRHRSNISRLLQGNENKLSFKKTNKV